jgi:3-deoxy-D-manno-octulosonic-acid transferase
VTDAARRCAGSSRTRLLLALYTVAAECLLPLAAARLLWLSLRRPGYGRRWWERFGDWPRSPAGAEVYWIHAVSVGEVRAALPIVRALSVARPAALVRISTTTATGAEALQAEGLGDLHAWAPFDAASVQRRLLSRLRPRAVVIMERELWPGLIRACARAGIPVLVANGRLPERSLAAYRRLPEGLRRRLFAGVHVAAQSTADAARFASLGVPDAAIACLGNTKLDDAPLPLWPVPRRLDAWMAASTHAGEEAAALAAQRELLARGQAQLLVLVPRHPERFEAVAALVAARGLDCARWSQGARVVNCAAPVLLVDTMGALRALYAEVGLAFVGGTLVPVGGHSLHEPLFAGTPVLLGPHHANVASVLAEAADAVTLLAGAEALAPAVAQGLAASAARIQAAEAAGRRLRAGAGAAERTVELLLRLADGARAET